MSLGVEEKSSKFAMSSCFTWMGSQSSMMNLSEREHEANNDKSDGKINNIRCKNSTYQILLLQGFNMYKSMFSFNIDEVLCMKQSNISLFVSFGQHPTEQAYSFAEYSFTHTQYLSFWASTKDLGSTFH